MKLLSWRTEMKSATTVIICALALSSSLAAAEANTGG